eukprot:CAMPEP_0115482746 /NCGR_PEP_ID=MMETSP0271-20121206/58491_1 /TAXON_ID=71861 /ORGANISM="Scrippsiella trochoidea, Strain CCMP3099" /LENGTH=63 /DNA_ID=CAMNT_0002910559 /DNA_START=68 /DNA_END=255 /DNA_ORIENTATION=-
MRRSPPAIYITEGVALMPLNRPGSKRNMIKRLGASAAVQRAGPCACQTLEPWPSSPPGHIHHR